VTKQGYVYILSNIGDNVFYVGVTSNLIKRIHQHKQGIKDGFTKRYNVKKLVYFEVFEDIYGAIWREKKLKGGSRDQKLSLIRRFNPAFRDLFHTLA
jgi:putative endonuclease